MYMSMFRRPLLGSLNAVWRFIEEFKHYPPVIKLEIPAGGEAGDCEVCCLGSAGADGLQVGGELRGHSQ